MTQSTTPRSDEEIQAMYESLCVSEFSKIIRGMEALEAEVEELRKAAVEFRDTVLNERGLIAGKKYSGEQNRDADTIKTMWRSP